MDDRAKVTDTNPIPHSGKTGTIGEKRKPPTILPDTDDGPDIVHPGPGNVPDGQTIKNE